MLPDSWSCVMVDKGPGMIDETTRTALKAAACHLHLQRVERMPVKGKGFDGVVTTEWKTYTLGTTSGVLFRSQIFSVSGDYFVNFLLNRRDLETGSEILRQIEESEPQWQRGEEAVPIEDLYRFTNLRRNSLN